MVYTWIFRSLLFLKEIRQMQKTYHLTHLNFLQDKTKVLSKVYKFVHVVVPAYCFK